MKVDSPLTSSQWSRYRNILERSNHRHKQLIAIVAPWTPLDPELNGLEEVWHWQEVHKMASKAARDRHSDAVAVFLARELVAFLEGNNMRSFEGFSNDDSVVMDGLAEVNSKLEAFLSEVSDSIARDLRGRATSKKYQIENYRGYQGVWCGIVFDFQSSEISIKVWVGVEFSSQQPRLQMWLWTDNMWPKPGENETSQTRVLKQCLREQGFEWDRDDGYWKYLRSQLDISERANDLVESVTRECTTILAGVFSCMRRS
jgi:hypothetical protein